MFLRYAAEKLLLCNLPMFLVRLLCVVVAALLLPAIAPAQLVRQANTTLNLPANLPSATGYTTENALGTLTFDDPIDLASLPGVANRLFVVERFGRLHMVNLDTMTKTVFLDLSAYLTSQNTPLDWNGENGFLSIAFHPNYNQNGYFYVFYSVSINSQLYQRVARFQANGTPGNYNAATSANASSHQPIITQRDQASNHNGGDLAFGPDGYLYISVGDEGGQRDTFNNSRQIAKDFFGGILRIDVDQRPGSLDPNSHDESSTGTVGDSAISAGTYRIPPDNPFVNLPADQNGNCTYNGYTFPKNKVRTEWYAIGLRNPWRMNFDMPTGRLFVADVGQDAWEEVNIVTSGFNGGWSWREGLHSALPEPQPHNPPAGFTSDPPIYEYAHGSGNFQGTSVAGGAVYRGNRLTELYEAYIFCDTSSGHIWALRPSSPTWTAQYLGRDVNMVSIGIDPRNGDILFCDFAGNFGQVKRLARTSTTGTQPPALLSQSGAFSDLNALTPQSGIVDYEPNVSFWSDYAIKRRWFSIKNTTDKIGFSVDGNWTFPTGMTWIKHFDIETRRGDPTSRKKLETRFLVKTTTDVYGLTYRWREDGSDADLVPEAGQDLTFAVEVNGQQGSQTWRFPSRNECRTCHTPVAGFALSFNTRQLNRTHMYGDVTGNLIGALSSAGYFSTPVTGVNHLPAFAAANDQSQSLEARVRSYLAVNCVQCHQSGGAALGNWTARPEVRTDAAGIINGPLVNNGGNSANRFAVPGDAALSMILKRLKGEGVPRMPPLGSNEIDHGTIALLTDWIENELPNRQSYMEWQQEHFASTTDPDAQPLQDPDKDQRTNALEFLQRTSPKVAASAPESTVITAVGGMFSLQFQHPANRSCLVETSSDLQTWELWDVPGNAPLFPRQDITRALIGPADGQKRFFRLKLGER